MKMARLLRIRILEKYRGKELLFLLKYQFVWREKRTIQNVATIAYLLDDILAGNLEESNL
jgi:hypothetical protein